MKSRQFCSVCKGWLEMEVVPTNDGDEDDGVIWFRCPQCQGFLPKLSGAEDRKPEPDRPGAAEPGAADTVSSAGPGDGRSAEMPWDSPADMMAAERAGGKDVVGPFLPEEEEAGAEAVGKGRDAVDSSEAEDAEQGEPLAEYAARLAAADTAAATPYRPWETYAEGQCVHHLAWDDCGVVVAKEELPGGRKVIKCYFESAGVVRLIEQAPR